MELLLKNDKRSLTFRDYRFALGAGYFATCALFSYAAENGNVDASVVALVFGAVGLSVRYVYRNIALVPYDKVSLRFFGPVQLGFSYEPRANTS